MEAGFRRHLGKRTICAIQWKWSIPMTSKPTGWWCSRKRPRKPAIELRLSMLDPAAAYKKVMEKRHDVAWMGWGTSYRPQFWEHFASVNAHKPQTNNITNTDDPVMDRLIEAYRNSWMKTSASGFPRKFRPRSTKTAVSCPPSWCPTPARGSGGGGGCPSRRGPNTPTICSPPLTLPWAGCSGLTKRPMMKPRRPCAGAGLSRKPSGG